MIADRVRVRTPRAIAEESGWEWESDGTGTFTVTPVDGALPRGTEVILHLKDDAKDFASRLADQGDRPALFELRPVPDSAGQRRRGHQRSEADLGRAQEPGHRGAVHPVLPAPDPPPRREAALAPAPGGRLADPVPRDRLLPADQPREPRLRPARARPEPLRQAGAGAERLPRAAARVPAIPPRPGRFRGPAAERLARDAAGQQRHPARSARRSSRACSTGSTSWPQDEPDDVPEVLRPVRPDPEGRADRRSRQSRADRQAAPLRLVAQRRPRGAGLARRVHRADAGRARSRSTTWAGPTSPRSPRARTSRSSAAAGSKSSS